MSEETKASSAAVPGKIGFGSFHSEREDERVDVLIAQRDGEYRPPRIPIDVEVTSYPVCVPEGVSKPNSVAFGADTKRDLFYLDQDCCFLNHGAFGAALRPVVDVARRWQTHMESQPLRFIDRQLLPLLVYTVREMAKFVNCDARDMVLIQNATTGLNCIFKSIQWRASDRVLTLDVGYGATRKMLKFVCHASGAVHDELKVELPLDSPDPILKLVERHLKAHAPVAVEGGAASSGANAVKLAVFDYINSNSALVLPVEELVALCARYGVPVLIDGAHSLGSMALDIGKLKPAYFVANAHKWLCSAKGCAIMYVERARQDGIVPLNISHGYGSAFTSNFIWTGLQDYGPWLSLTAALAFWRSCGVLRVRSHIHNTVRAAVELLSEAWGTDALAPPDMFGPMACVRVPGPRVPRHDDENNSLQDALYFRFNIECPVKMLSNRLWVRISVHVYNSLDEFRKLADAMMQIRPRLSVEEEAADAAAFASAEVVKQKQAC